MDDTPGFKIGEKVYPFPDLSRASLIEAAEIEKWSGLTLWEWSEEIERMERFGRTPSARALVGWIWLAMFRVDGRVEESVFNKLDIDDINFHKGVAAEGDADPPVPSETPSSQDPGDSSETTGGSSSGSSEVETTEATTQEALV